ncbi:hypothetical protein Asulf_02283 [Archaeoglobus sulfaticallidus PM70-1]|uniref:Antitoxin n=1 Tax=Archaeoglobus sulfaticallidus PM70-1 TaxID=387631 RepID=N0BPE5_9EURY|nr:antitoxin family protein [Archaeoglobus sulfaticallidus]AGK62235.1 hypothetical protein Asulf_02283 [Archaeoglobus sulfaticallidus PM70-1]
MKVKAIYENGVLKLMKKLDLPEKTEVSVIIKGSFSKLLDELGEIEAKEDVNTVLEEMRVKSYYE